MLLKFSCIILLLNISIILSDSISVAELNETIEFHPISQLSKFESKLDEDSIKTADIQNVTCYPRNCAEIKRSGMYEILIPRYSNNPFKVFCDAETQGGGWTVILSRLDGSENFYRNWNTYKKGFGNVDGESFLGLEKIHALTADYSQELLVLLEDFNGLKAFEMYDRFGITDESEQFALNTLGQASGTAGDSLSYQKNMKFSTFDRDNDRWANGSCAQRDTGAWWYNTCRNSNLAGTYKDNSYNKGVNWDSFRGKENSLKIAIMMIRPRK